MDAARRFIATVCSVALLALVESALSDVDISEYQSKARPGPEHERARIRDEIEQEARAEAARAAQLAEEEERRAAAERARLEARPYSVKLTERRCTLCHGADNYTAIGHTWLGWQTVVLRMQYLNNCPLEPGEPSVIVAHLSEAYPASTADALVEWGAGVLTLMFPIVSAAGLRAWRRHGRSAAR